ncbi:MAG: archease [Candidatus Pacearchaeota archaeon]
MSYEFLENTADVKFRAEGYTIEEMFISSAEALNEVIRGDIKILAQKEKMFEIKVKDVESLLHDFLEEFLYLLDAEKFLYSNFKELKIDEENLTLKATILGDSEENYTFTNDVKAVTYNEMVIKKAEGRYLCEVVLDV